MRILIVDDHPLFRAGLTALLFELDTNIETAEAASLAQACERKEQGESFDLVLLDLNLPDAAGLSGLHRIKATFEAALVVVMSAVEEPQLIFSVLDAGACGYIPKTTDPTATVQALRLVLARGIYLPPSAMAGRDRSEAIPVGATPRRGASDLSERQLQVLQRLLHGKPNKIIARELDIAERTVKAHLQAIYQALNVATRTQAMYRAHELGLFERFAGPLQR